MDTIDVDEFLRRELPLNREPRSLMFTATEIENLESEMHNHKAGR